jgi:hypothetical protein
VRNTSEKAQRATTQATSSTICKHGYGLATLNAILRPAVFRGLGWTASNSRPETTAGFSKLGLAPLTRAAAR